MSIPSSALTGPMADLRLEQLGLVAAELHECMFAGYRRRRDVHRP